jgi:hypothetical protein
MGVGMAGHMAGTIEEELSTWEVFFTNFQYSFGGGGKFVYRNEKLLRKQRNKRSRN